mgnify:CR=1 FL=1
MVRRGWLRPSVGRRTWQRVQPVCRLRMVWGVAYESETHLLRVNVSNLRRKIEMDPLHPCHIITEPGVGYRLRNIEEDKE